MIKIALKHWIYEACINLLFDKILNNFNKPDVAKLKVGDKFHRIIVYKPDNFYTRFGLNHLNYLEYDNAEIMKIDKSKICISCYHHSYGFDILVNFDIDIKDITEFHR